MRHNQFTLFTAVIFSFTVGVFFSPEIRQTVDFFGARTSATTVNLQEPDSVEVRFSPRGGCTEAIVAAIRQAKNSVYLQAYSFTSAQIADALIDAHRSGIAVGVILDKSHRSQRAFIALRLHAAGIPLWIDSRHAIAHSKVIIIDSRRVITGSFNFTKAAEGANSENLLLIRDDKLAAIYLENWEAHRNHSSPFSPDSLPKTNLGEALN